MCAKLAAKTNSLEKNNWEKIWN